jgi:hypothetical protein
MRSCFGRSSKRWSADAGYTITANYADVVNANGVANFARNNAAVPGTLSVNLAATAVTTNSVTTTFSNAMQFVTLTANVTSPTGGGVNEGMVRFTVGGRTATGGVHNGIATALVSLPGGFPVGSYAITASCSDVGDYLPSSARAAP